MTKKILILTLCFVFSFVFSKAALAFHLGDHTIITQQALKEFEKCYPRIFQKEEPFFLLTSDLEEDINVVRKDLLFSHYFNPDKVLPMFRKDSLARITDLATDIKNDQNSILLYMHVGHALHHLQDMSVPAHVTPITHGFNDTFETYEVKKQNLESGLSCQELEKLARQVPALSELLVAAARNTLNEIEKLTVPITRVDNSGTVNFSVPGKTFWQSVDGNEFGRYGSLGEHFGEIEVSFTGNIKIKVPEKFYEDFKNHALQKAVINSWIALFQFHHPAGKESQRTLQTPGINPLSYFQMQTLQKLAQLFSI